MAFSYRLFDTKGDTKSDTKIESKSYKASFFIAPFLLTPLHVLHKTHLYFH